VAPGIKTRPQSRMLTARSILLEFPVQRLSIHCQDLGGLCLVSAHQVEYAQNLAAFDLLHGEEFTRI